MLTAFLFQIAETLSSTVIPVVILLLTIGTAYGFSLNGSRTRAIIGAVAAGYAALGPQISAYTAMPGWLRTLLIVIGIAFTVTGERVQGGASDPSVRKEAAAVDKLETVRTEARFRSDNTL